MEIGSYFNLYLKYNNNNNNNPYIYNNNNCFFYISGRIGIKNILENINSKHKKKCLIPNYLCEESKYLPNRSTIYFHVYFLISGKKINNS